MGDDPDGHTPNGHVPMGSDPDGHTPPPMGGSHLMILADGHTPNRHVPMGDDPDGHTPNGWVPLNDPS